MRALDLIRRRRGSPAKAVRELPHRCPPCRATRNRPDRLGSVKQARLRRAVQRSTFRVCGRLPHRHAQDTPR
jgi:hypothetical protein